MRYAKFYVALATALAVLAPLLAGGLTGPGVISVALAFLGALGVYAVPNTPPAAPSPAVAAGKAKH